MASTKPTTRLRELHGSGYEISKGQPDIRGWDVRDDHRRKFGKVQELIFDIRAGKVRYMVINIFDTKELELEKRTVLVPIGLAVLDSTDDDVILSTVTPFQLRALPRYDKTALGAKVERDVSHVFGRDTNADTVSSSDDVESSFYDHDHFNESNMEKNRRGIAGSSNTDTQHNTTGTHPVSTHKEGIAHNNSNVSGSTKKIVNQNETDAEAIRRVRQNEEGVYIKETDDEYYRRTGKHR